MADEKGKGAGKQALAPDVLAARAAEQRERDAAAFAEREYDLARQFADVNTDGNGFWLGRGFGRGYSGPPPPQPQLGSDVTDFAPPAPQSVTDTANAFVAATQAMKAIAESLDNRFGNNSRGRDGDIVINKDVSQVFDQVPEDILERVKYVKSIVNRLTANTSGVRFKTDSETIQSLRVTDDATVPANYKMYTFKNVPHRSRIPRVWFFILFRTTKMHNKRKYHIQYSIFVFFKLRKI